MVVWIKSNCSKGIFKPIGFPVYSFDVPAAAAQFLSRKYWPKCRIIIMHIAWWVTALTSHPGGDLPHYCAQVGEWWGRVCAYSLPLWWSWCFHRRIWDLRVTWEGWQHCPWNPGRAAQLPSQRPGPENKDKWEFHEYVCSYKLEGSFRWIVFRYFFFLKKKHIYSNPQN